MINLHTNSIIIALEHPRQSLKKNNSKIGKKRMHPVEEKILNSLESYEKRANKTLSEDDNHYFALSLVPSLISLPRHLNTKCRIEIMQTISKYASMAEQNQTAPIIPFSQDLYHIHNNSMNYLKMQPANRTPHHLQQLHQLNQLQAIIHILRRTILTLVFLI